MSTQGIFLYGFEDLEANRKHERLQCMSKNESRSAKVCRTACNFGQQKAILTGERERERWIGARAGGEEDCDSIRRKQRFESNKIRGKIYRVRVFFPKKVMEGKGDLVAGGRRKKKEEKRGTLVFFKKIKQKFAGKSQLSPKMTQLQEIEKTWALDRPKNLIVSLKC